MYKKYVQLRDAKGVTDYEVAKRTGLTTATLSQWKHGVYVPKVDKLIKIADYFGITLDELVRGTDENQRNGSGEETTDKS